MKDLKQKVAYLQGLAEGMELKESKEGKVVGEILDVLSDMAEYLDFLREQQDDMEEYLESVDSDLADVEEEVFGDEDDDYECDCCDEDLIDVECPNCHETVCFDAAILTDEDEVEVTCPVCNAVVFSNSDEFEIDDDDDDEDDD